MSYKKIHTECLRLKNKEKIKLFQSFFKTQKGQYAYGDIFWGITVPESKKVAKKYKDLSSDHIQKLLCSKIHEERSIGLHILKFQYLQAVKEENVALQKKIYRLFFKLKARVNNWDLVDTSAPSISGHFYFHHDKSDLLLLSESRSLWDRRIAIVSMFYFIRQNAFSFALDIIEKHLEDKEDLIHKACGWMLREIGKRDKKILVDFLQKYSAVMSRTTLRYAIEKFTSKERTSYLKVSLKVSRRLS